MVRVLMTGASGLIGTAIRGNWPDAFEWVALSRRARPSEKNTQWLCWDAMSDPAPWGQIGEVDGIVHLLGEGVADKRWSVARKKLIIKSRVNGTENLLSSMVSQAAKPKWILAASAVGYYGNSGSEECAEDHAAGRDFLGKTCVSWEAAQQKAQRMGIRTCTARIGLVLSRNGGMLKKMLPVFRFGLGAPLGSGQQWMSWIHEQDLVQALLWLVEQEKDGPFNLCAPQPVNNRQFSKTLARVLKRPCWFPIPAWVLKLGLGQLSEAVLGGQKALPKRLESEGFEFLFQQLEPALLDLLGKVPQA